MIKNHIKTITRDFNINFDRSKYLRLDSNERVIPFSKKVLLGLKKNILNNIVQSYPKDKKKILQLISRYEKINSKYISCFPGIDTNLKHIFEAFSFNEKKFLSFFPTYGMIDVYSRIYKLKIIKVPEKKILQLTRSSKSS